MSRRDDGEWLTLALVGGALWLLSRPGDPPQERGALPPGSDRLRGTARPMGGGGGGAPAGAGRALTVFVGINVDGMSRAFAGGSDGIGRRLTAQFPRLLEEFNAQHKGTLSSPSVVRTHDTDYGTGIEVLVRYAGDDAPAVVVDRLHTLLLAHGGDVASRLHSLTLLG